MYSYHDTFGRVILFYHPLCPTECRFTDLQIQRLIGQIGTMIFLGFFINRSFFRLIQIHFYQVKHTQGIFFLVIRPGNTYSRYILPGGYILPVTAI